ncbi:hypothetical protein KBX53_02115 [Micromonospora sp. M51]|uniref:lipase/acyltransferase domain-containing protein n=1 Tax=Micromonospora TaxID=1873 RepID=UPI001B375A97|nr:hypothetical protein [Micromonospora sp. M51]MBQ1009769.1 hypothetical protein [Micromonospora sp. M51]
MSDSVRRNITQDAVIVVPGIMGSVLTGPDETLWGFELGTYARMWSGESSPLDALALDDDQLVRLTDESRKLTPEEVAGRFDNVTATGLLRFPAYAPLVRASEPYGSLVRSIGRCVAHQDAILEFAYDWRLPVRYNAKRLAIKAAEHLRRWRAHPRHDEARRLRPDSRPAQLVLVAHSMGGLVCRALGLHDADPLNIRATVTLGTPFEGAVKAAMLLNRGQGAPTPLPRRRLRAMAATLPGVHDLLPYYRCVDQGDNSHPRRLTPADVARFGGNEHLAREAIALQRQASSLPLVEHHALIGTAQSTQQTMSLRDGFVIPHRHTFQLHSDGDFLRESNGTLVRIDDGGDGTVPRNSATLTNPRPATLPQQHGALAQTPEAIQLVCDVLTERETGSPRLGGGELGLDLPDIVAPGVEWAAVISGVNGPNDASCVVADAFGRQIDRSPVYLRDDSWRATVVLPEPGIFRVTVHGGGTSAITQLVLADDPGGLHV